MIYPQAVWYVCLLLFAVASIMLAAIATRCMLRRDFERLNADFKPKGVMEELDDELGDIERRQSW